MQGRATSTEESPTIVRHARLFVQAGLRDERWKMIVEALDHLKNDDLNDEAKQECINIAAQIIATSNPESRIDLLGKAAAYMVEIHKAWMYGRFLYWEFHLQEFSAYCTRIADEKSKNPESVASDARTFTKAMQRALRDDFGWGQYETPNI